MAGIGYTEAPVSSRTSPTQSPAGGQRGAPTRLQLNCRKARRSCRCHTAPPLGEPSANQRWSLTPAVPSVTRALEVLGNTLASAGSWPLRAHTTSPSRSLVVHKGASQTLHKRCHSIAAGARGRRYADRTSRPPRHRHAPPRRCSGKRCYSYATLHTSGRRGRAALWLLRPSLASWPSALLASLLPRPMQATLPGSALAQTLPERQLLVRVSGCHIHLPYPNCRGLTCAEDSEVRVAPALRPAAPLAGRQKTRRPQTPSSKEEAAPAAKAAAAAKA